MKPSEGKAYRSELQQRVEDMMGELMRSPVALDPQEVWRRQSRNWSRVISFQEADGFFASNYIANGRRWKK